MRNDPEAQLERVLHFMQVPVSDEYLAYAIDKYSFENMKRYEAQGAFAASELRPGDPSVAESFKVRKGRVGGYRAYLTAEEIRRLDELIDARLVPLYRY
jgi:alcohol sulfotransferase